MYQQAKAELLARINSQWAPGTRMPSIHELASELGIGQASVNKAVQELVAEGILVSRRRLGTYVLDQSRPGAMKSGTRGQSLKGKSISIFSRWPYTDQMIHLMRTALANHLIAQGADVQQDDSMPGKGTWSVAANADACVLLNPNSTLEVTLPEGRILTVVTTGAAPSVVVPSHTWDLVSIGQEHGGWLAGEHAREVGWRSACCLGVRKSNDEKTIYDATSAQRLEGFERGWGQSIPSTHQLKTKAYGDGWGARLMLQYLRLRPRPQGIFACSDELAIGFEQGAAAHGLTAGADYQLIGFDGQHRGRELIDGPLTSVAVPAEEMGLRAAELLAERFANPTQSMRFLALGCELFVGQSTAPMSTYNRSRGSAARRQHNKKRTSTKEK